ncbi:Gfo/Idh/MocA family protein [Silvibacterium dinghuense]|uniref:Gfo/Idh/MocA family oxidoreductase n=1 Tax=Silvibacterium dinghuense TaxID=1560006 RepID=A0A4Q1SJU2_9BACT|nr:Gfo/Idh/MocA family oxidoreductase [Silvibacterium dinghuense]RXS97931.1 Gfo/Idh/MocA family oxidoreductase [Silvibacterium dinghuense]GGH03089.1 glucose-fructose oxidoreductase [Silvibacterium dinghuense]
MTRYGILGFGHHAVRRLLKGFRESSHSQLTGLWRRDAEKASANAREYAIPLVFETPEALCASPEIDAVFIASPDALHLPHVLMAAAAGKPILCEKPLGMNANEVALMLSAAHEAGVPFGVAQNFRYNPSVERMHQWIAEGRIGRPRLAHAQFAYAADHSPRQWIYDPALACGGPIGDVGVHCIDALRYLLSDEVTSVTTLAHGDTASGHVESYAAIGLGFASGAVGTVTVTTRAAYRSLVEVTGENGVIVCEDGLTVDHPVELVLRQNGSIVESISISNEDAYSRMLDGFSAWIQGRGEYRAPGVDGLHNQRILDAAYASWRMGTREEVDPTPAA